MLITMELNDAFEKNTPVLMMAYSIIVENNVQSTIEHCVLFLLGSSYLAINSGYFENIL